MIDTYLLVISRMCIYLTDNPHDLIYGLVLVFFSRGGLSLFWVRQSWACFWLYM